MHDQWRAPDEEESYKQLPRNTVRQMPPEVLPCWQTLPDRAKRENPAVEGGTAARADPIRNDPRGPAPAKGKTVAYARLSHDQNSNLDR
jgi:hypothetical protein